MLNFDKTYTSWTNERIARHILYWLAWLLFYPTINAYKEGSFLSWVEIELLAMSIKLPFVYFVIYYLVPNYLIRKKYLTFFLSAFGLAILGAVCIRAIEYYIISEYILASFGWQGGSFWRLKYLYKVLDLIYIASLPTIIKLLQGYIQQEKLSNQLNEQKLEAELQLLRNQLHPHFLFNTLNNLYAMVLTRDSQAPNIVLRLSQMMEYMLYDCDVDQMSLDKEIAHLKNYIELEKIRFGDRVEVSFEAGGVLEDKLIAPLILMAFVENAFKHGASNNKNPSWIRINLWATENQLDFLVENNFPEESMEEEGMIKGQSGIGLKNVRKRLQVIYPKQHELKITSGESYLVQLKIKTTAS